MMTMEALSIYLLTWNVVTMDPPAIALLRGLFETGADLIAVGLQEVRSQPQNVIADAIYEDAWTNSVRDILAQKDYVKIHTIRLVGILLSVYSKKAHITSIRNVEASYTRTGLNGLWGNKGAVSIRFNYKGNSVCFVNCHLSPHDGQVEQRVANYHSIINSQTFQKEKISSILDHDLVFWFGDLNFRLEPNSYSASEIVDMLASNDLKPLLERDELNKTITSRSAFPDFSECKISFKPTYKFVQDSQNYDKKRRPAWTDRIIYRSFEDGQSQQQRKTEKSPVTCSSYDSYPSFTMSDHKPVAAHFQVNVKGGALDTVSFAPIQPWVSGTVGSISYTLPAIIEPSTWHWIAFFREQYSSLGEYVTYVWAPKQPLPGKPRSYRVEVPENSMRVPGRYFAAYMSDTQPYHVLGISPVFEVDEPEEEHHEL